MKITIDIVAKKAGVSKTTVSRILNGNFAHTKDETKNRVLRVIKELDYRPNALAKGLKSSHTNVIGIVLSNLQNPFWITVLDGVEAACQSLGYNLMISNSAEQPEMEVQYIREFQTRQLDGIVINPTVRNLALYHKLADSKFPMVVINRRVPELNVHHVIMNNMKGASLATQQLLSNGRKKVAAFVYGNAFVSTWKERVDGYRSVMQANGYGPEDWRILELDQRGDVQVEISRYLRCHPETDAIFSTNNMLTLEAIEVVKELGLRMPEDIAIVSYDEMIWAKHLDPPLTTIMQPGYKMGYLAAQMLIKTIKAKRKPRVETVVLEPELIVRKSCGVK
ncbi:LacI family DNA-binding transcriptional regulator [Paenibacillus abyssi]|uniref:LacI family transcriptional regulator n=1 Tax=Paenibacillus abyssi TaxID=1340531 RepID=A0A917CM36_9BACL|nr:LacI family DNA-binding transcriptional regulator [Paenibacillus abyssi]GGF90721.1 LacI family transcriptional regulator [Paenibacillus abyssi]